MEDNWLTIENGILTNCSHEAEGEIVIPNSVTKIDEHAFARCSGLTSIVIPNSVTEIGKSAFQYCSALTSIVIPNSVTKIGESAFSSCKALTSIVIPDSVTEIGESAFSWCEVLTDIVIPNSVTEIGDSAFAECSALTSIVIPDSVTEIGDWTFYLCSALTSIVMPDSVTKIGKCAFSYCSALTSIVIPNSVTEIGGSAFAECSALTSIVIPDSVTKIGFGIVQECKNLTSIEMPDSVTEIDEDAFHWCRHLTIIVRLKSVTKIVDGPFFDLKESHSIAIMIHASVSEIDTKALRDCSWLSSIKVDENNKVYDSRNDCNAIIETASNTLIFGSREAVIPDTVTKIGDDALKYRRRLDDIVIPNSVTSIGNNAFGDTQINKLVFEGAIPETNNSFSNCTIKELRVNTPRKLTNIPDDIFKALKNARDKKWDGGYVIYAVPELCQEESAVPGYIKAIRVTNDELIDINTAYIVAIEPYELTDRYEKYQPHTGTLITCAANDTERACTFLVYEPKEMISHKITQSLTTLSQKVGGIPGLLNIIDTLCKCHNEK